MLKEENELLTRVGPGTPMGNMMRRYWIPACLSEELPAPDCDPLRVRLLGEDLVAFRDSHGRVGLMDELCPHRRAALYLGRNEEGGIRCLYHGWKMDVDGNVLDMPCEPADAANKDRIKQLVYPTHEAGGFVWTYMGPVENLPPFPSYEWTLVPETNRSIAKTQQECNYLQACEGTVDYAHAAILHHGTVTLLHPDPERDVDIHARASLEDTPYGYVIGTAVHDMDDPENLDYVFTTTFVAPFYCIVPPRGVGHVHLYVPIDDTHTWDYSDYFSHTRLIDHEAMLRRRRVMPEVDLLPDRRRKRNLANNLLQDRLAMRERRSFTGIGDNPHEDEGIQESMGTILDRTREHLVPTDMGVIHLRMRLLAAVRDFMAGGEPLGMDPAIDYSEVRCYRKLLPKGVPWTEIATFPGDELVADHVEVATVVR